MNAAFEKIIVEKSPIEESTLFGALLRNAYADYIAENVSIMSADKHNIDEDKEMSSNYDINTPFTTTGQKLMEMGYDIVVLDIKNTLYFENHPDYEKAYPSYYCTMVKINDKWYIAEEINTHSR